MRGWLSLSAALAVAACVLAGAAAGGSAKPVIGRPVASSPAKAGARFTVSFYVAHARSVAFSDTLDKARLHHTDSFRGGVARTTMTLPGSAKGSVHVKLTARSAGGSATKSASFAVTAAVPSELQIEDAQAQEGNSGTTPLGFEVDLAPASAETVTVHYATSDGTATAGSDYVATSGTLTFAPGQTVQTITVPVAGDLNIEPDETFSVTLSNAVNATLSVDTGTGTIQNDDQAKAGNWQGVTQNGDNIYFSVTSDQKETQIRVNNISEDCGGGEEFQVEPNFGPLWIQIQPDGSYNYSTTWSGSETDGDFTFTSEADTFKGQFATATAMTGTLGLQDQFTYQGTSYNCATTVTLSGDVPGLTPTRSSAADVPWTGDNLVELSGRHREPLEPRR